MESSDEFIEVSENELSDGFNDATEIVYQRIAPLRICVYTAKC